MIRIWNALRYGDSGTRKSIGSVIFFSVLGIGLIIASGLSGQFYLFVLGMLAGVAAIIISQSFTLVDDNFVAETGKNKKKESVETVSVVKEKREDSKKEMPSEDMVHKEQKIEEAEFSRYNEQMIKKLKRKYHVKKDHRPVLIDNSKSYRIKECPAFIWRVHNKVYLLLLEKEPRRISISRELIRHVDYVPNVRANREKEYLAFRKENLITSVFSGYLPDYYDSKAKDTNLKYKNLYQIYPDIQFSNRSISQVMDLLCLNFMPEDKLTKSDKVNGYFKRIYAANILYKDRVYSITEYKEAVETALEEMCYAEIPAAEFAITMENLVQARLISQEYADHYLEVRNKTGKKTVVTTYRR
ncbi:MAG: hypothetical protein PUC12_15995 [Clostridiales bacterium]|nr:hypothetical protein [Clostridiales bacterium]